MERSGRKNRGQSRDGSSAAIQGPASASPQQEGRLYLAMRSCDVGFFRFLLEGYENLAFFTVLQTRPAILKLVFVQENRKAVLQALAEIATSVDVKVLPCSKAAG